MKVPLSPFTGHSNGLKGTNRETYRETFKSASCLSCFCHTCCQLTVGERIKNLCQLLKWQLEPSCQLVSSMQLHSPCHSFIEKVAFCICTTSDLISDTDENIWGRLDVQAEVERKGLQKRQGCLPYPPPCLHVCHWHHGHPH